MKKKGFTLVELLVVIAIIALLMGILMPALARVRMIAYRMVCGSNLAGIGKALLLYAGDNSEAYPLPGVGPLVPVYRSIAAGSWQRIPAYWQSDPTGAFQPSAGTHGGTATIASVFYMLIRYQDVSPKQFNCKGDTKSEIFKASSVTGNTQTDLTKLYDFGENPARYCSYSYHFPFARTNTGSPVSAGFPVSVNSKPGAPLAADRNPGLDKNAESYLAHSGGATQGGTLGSAAQAATSVLPFVAWSAPPAPNEYRDKDFIYNSAAHQREGQNVLYNDGHVKFESTTNVGIDNDNIYQRCIAPGSASGTTPMPSGPTAKRDREVGGYFPTSAFTNTYNQFVPADYDDALLINEVVY
jgi:prepilin-type N-terminal cleavage/methylation domain-containing protein